MPPLTTVKLMCPLFSEAFVCQSQAFLSNDVLISDLQFSSCFVTVTLKVKVTLSLSLGAEMNQFLKAMVRTYRPCFGVVLPCLPLPTLVLKTHVCRYRSVIRDNLDLLKCLAPAFWLASFKHADCAHCFIFCLAHVCMHFPSLYPINERGGCDVYFHVQVPTMCHHGRHIVHVQCAKLERDFINVQKLYLYMAVRHTSSLF